MPIEEKNASKHKKKSNFSLDTNWMSYEVLRSLRRKALAIIAGLAIVLSLFGLLVDARQPQPPVFVSVSIKTLLEEHLQSLSRLDENSLLSQQKTREYLNAIDAVVQDLTAQGDVIVLISEAVVGSGIPDFTDDVRYRVREKLNLDISTPEERSDVNNIDTSTANENSTDSSQEFSR